MGGLERRTRGLMGRGRNTQGAMMKSRIKMCGVVMMAIAALMLAGCNTTKGFGKDIEGAGEGLKNSAERSGAD